MALCLFSFVLFLYFLTTGSHQNLGEIIPFQQFVGLVKFKMPGGSDLIRGDGSIL